MTDLSGEPRPGTPRSEDKALQDATRSLAQVKIFAENLHHDLPAGDRREVARWVRVRLLEILGEHHGPAAGAVEPGRRDRPQHP